MSDNGHKGWNHSRGDGDNKKHIDEQNCTSLLEIDTQFSEDYRSAGEQAELTAEVASLNPLRPRSTRLHTLELSNDAQGDWNQGEDDGQKGLWQNARQSVPP